MCYFDQYRFACGCWKWAQFRACCNEEYRAGETCGMKLARQTYGIKQKCKICQKIDRKRRRQAQEQERLDRFAKEGKRYGASIEKARQVIAALDNEIHELERVRHKEENREGLTPDLEALNLPYPKSDYLDSRLRPAEAAIDQIKSRFDRVARSVTLETAEPSGCLRSESVNTHKDDEYRNGELEVPEKLIGQCLDPRSNNQEEMLNTPTIHPEITSEPKISSFSSPRTRIERSESTLEVLMPLEPTLILKFENLISLKGEAADDSENDIKASSDGSLSSWTDCSEISLLGQVTSPSVSAAGIRFLQTLREAFEDRYPAFKSCAVHEDGPSSSDCGIKDSPALTTSTSSGQNGKRQAGNGDDRSSEDDDSSRKRRQIGSSSSQTPDRRLLACPFYKYNRICYRKCSTSILREISRLKQHLDRNHRIPFHCASCFQEFESEAGRDDHSRQRICDVLPPKTFEGIDEIQRRQLKKRCSPQKTREENWYLIYDILFPKVANRPDNPYLEEALSAELLAFQDFCFLEGPDILRLVVSSELPEELQSHEEQVHRVFQTAFHDGLRIILERWESRNPTEKLSMSSASRQTLNRPIPTPLEARPTDIGDIPRIRTTRLGPNNPPPTPHISDFIRFGPSVTLPDRDGPPVQQEGEGSLAAEIQLDPLASDLSGNQEPPEIVRAVDLGLQNLDSVGSSSFWEEYLFIDEDSDYLGGLLKD